MSNENAVKTAIAKVLGKEAVELPVGVHDIDEVVTVRVKGTVTKRADTSKTPTVSVPLKATLALLLDRMGFQRDAASAILVECMTEALKLGDKATGLVEERLADVEASLKRVAAVTEALPKTVVKGATIVDCEVEILADFEIKSTVGGVVAEHAKEDAVLVA